MSMRFLTARIAGEMKPSDVPLAPGVDIAAIKSGDGDPMEVVVEVPAGKSTRGWNYRGEALQDIVNHVNQHTLSGFLGHQKETDVANEFPTPVTHWVGAVWKDGKAYFRGVIDKVAPDLKRWIRSKRVKEVSIFGAPKLKQVNGETHVVGYRPLSIDWTPLGRNGMPTSIVSVGEMDSTFDRDLLEGELDGSHEGLRDSLRQAVQAKLGGDGIYIGIERVFDDHVIVVYEKQGTRRLYDVRYSLQDDAVVLGDEKEVELEIKREYKPVGEMRGADTMTLVEMLANIRSAIAKKETDFLSVLGEIGVTREQAIDILAGEQLKALRTGAEYGAKLAAALGFNKDMNTEAALVLAGEMAGLSKALGLVPGANVDAVKTTLENLQAVWKALGFDQKAPEKPAEVAGEMAKIYGEQHQKTQSALVDKAIAAKVSGEQAQGLIKRMLRVPDDATEEQISGEIDTLLKDEVVKGLIGSHFVDQAAGTGGSSVGSGSDPGKSGTGNLRKKTVSV